MWMWAWVGRGEDHVRVRLHTYRCRACEGISTSDVGGLVMEICDFIDPCLDSAWGEWEGGG